ncbi:MAG: CHAT domain-containing protein [Saprospiraceae bacterium]|nr:CHAT domain-containing protein [Saprospiraceae bacterium]
MNKAILIILLCCPFMLSGQFVDSVALKTVDSLVQVSRGLTEKGDFAKALEVNAAVEALALEKWGHESAGYASACYNHGRVLYFKDDYTEAEKWYFEARVIREKVLGKNHLDYAKTMQSIGLLYYWMGKYSEAESPSLEALSIFERIVGKEDANYIYSLHWLGILYYQKGQYEKAEPLLLEAKDIRKKKLGSEHADYAASLNMLGVLYMATGKYENAEQYYLEANALQEKRLGKTDADYVGSILNLAVLYWKMGKYEKAEPLYLKVKAIQEKGKSKGDAYYSTTINNLAALYSDMGNYEKAEPLYLEAVAIREKKMGKEHPLYAASLNNLASLYHRLGNYEKAAPLYLESLAIRGKTLGKTHPDFALSLNNLASLYKELNDYEKAKPYLLEAVAVQAEALGKSHPDYAFYLHELGNYYAQIGKNEDAETILLEAKNIREKALGKTHPDYARSLNDLASFYLAVGDHGKAEPLFLEAKNIREAVLGSQHPSYIASLDALVAFYWSLGNLSAARTYISEANMAQKNLLIKASRHLSEQELTAFTRKFETGQRRVFSFAQLQPDLSATCFDNTLFHKGFLLNAVSQVSKIALSDPATTEQYNQLKSYQRRLAAEYAKPIAERKNVEELEEKANTLEKDLTRSVSGFGEALRQVTWQEVRQNLQPGEAAIEFVHFKFINPKPTDSTMYAALVLLPGAKAPKFITLFEEKQLNAFLEPNSKPKPDFVNGLYTFDDAKKSLYELLWRPLEQDLSEVNTVYFSPSGLLHRLNMGAVPMPPMLRGEAAETTLADRYQLVELGSTRQLAVGNRQSAAKGTEALLYGGIQYEMDSTAIASAISSLGNELLATRRGLDFANADSTLRGGKWSHLRWTGVEVSTTEEILTDAGLHPLVRKGYDGTEESFKAIGASGPSPWVLHLATHGFFFPDPKTTDGGRQTADGGEPVFKISEHSMIRAGLVLAGGNYAWQTGKPFRPDQEDGILTAYEISQMNLSNTELVVLSACETGLGDIQGNEGVYGLQRAFKIAGAKYLIMSLWQVPDFQTQELMTSFYSLWLEDKMTIPDAFRAAQKAMKEKYKSPFLWAGFVLVE